LLITFVKYHSHQMKILMDFRKILSAVAGLVLLSSIIIISSCDKTLYLQPSPKNVIIMISDGCGYDHIQVANLYEFGKTNAQPYESFPVRYYVSTYPALCGKYGEEQGVYPNSGYSPYETWNDFDWRRHGYTGSAAAATAMATGVKTYNGAIGVNVSGEPLLNIIERSKMLGKSAGVVTTVQLNHATPASYVVHNKDRHNYSEIARAMLLESRIDVIMGCGHPYYDNNGKKLKYAHSFKYVGDSLLWEDIRAGKKIFDRKSGIKVKMPDVNGDREPDHWHFIETKEEFINLADGETPVRVLGVPRVKKTLQQERGDSIAGHFDAFEYPMIESVPELSDMTMGALNVLDNNARGFFLMVEGGAIDWASHDNQKGRVIEEEIDFNKAVRAVIKWVEENSSWNETLLIVTADHETGYICGPASGPGEPPVWNAPEGRGSGKMPRFEFHSDGHTNALIPLYAKGKGSELFSDYADEYDPRRGEFITNSEIGQLLFRLLGRERNPATK
jgi:alkaline phosphatase